jgi:hypothetical protein
MPSAQSTPTSITIIVSSAIIALEQGLPQVGVLSSRALFLHPADL